MARSCEDHLGWEASATGRASATVSSGQIWCLDLMLRSHTVNLRVMEGLGLGRQVGPNSRACASPWLSGCHLPVGTVLLLSGAIATTEMMQ